MQVTRKNLYFFSAEEKFGKNFSAQGADKDFTGVEENFHVLKRPLSVYGLAEELDRRYEEHFCAQYPNNSRISNESTFFFERKMSPL